uniref:Uncharacterized protein n=1 Tax=Cannabis sativa TaxID=3483 RepID=A0A803R784_CANSA
MYIALVAKPVNFDGKQSCNESHQHVIPYTIPSWSEPPGHNLYLKEGSMTNQVHIQERSLYIWECGPLMTLYLSILVSSLST